MEIMVKTAFSTIISESPDPSGKYTTLFSVRVMIEGKLNDFCLMRPTGSNLLLTHLLGGQSRSQTL